MRHVLALIAALLLAAPVSAQLADLDYSGDCADADAGCETGEDFLAANAEEVKDKLNAHIAITNLIDADNDGVVDEAATVSAGAIDATALGSNAVTAVKILDANVTEAKLASEDYGDFTCGGSADDCVLDSGVVDATAIASGALTAADAAADLATQAELDAKSVASSTDNAVARFDSTAGDIQDSGVTVDDSNNVTIPGTITSGGTEVPTCIIMRDSDDAGDTACEVLNGAWDCEVDTNGTCGDAT